MPTISYRSRLRAVSDHCGVSLNVRHRLVVGEPSDRLHSTAKTRFPKDVDVLLTSNLTIVISGSFDGHELSATDIATSSFSQHLVSYFRAVKGFYPPFAPSLTFVKNAEELGLNTVSDVYVDVEDRLPKCPTLSFLPCIWLTRAYTQ